MIDRIFVILPCDQKPFNALCSNGLQAFLSVKWLIHLMRIHSVHGHRMTSSVCVRSLSGNDFVHLEARGIPLALRGPAE